MYAAISRVVSRPSERGFDVAQVNKATVMNCSAKSIHLSGWSQASSTLLRMANYFILVTQAQPWEIVGVIQVVSMFPPACLY